MKKLNCKLQIAKFLLLTAYFLLLTSSGEAGVNLKPYTPTGGDAPLILSTEKDLSSEDTLFTNYPYYISFGVENNGDQNIESSFHARVTVADTVVLEQFLPYLDAGQKLPIKYKEDTLFTPGEHPAKLILDPFGEVIESDETDNEWSRTFYWKEGEFPDIWVSPESLYYEYTIPVKKGKFSGGYWDENQVTVTVDIPEIKSNIKNQISKIEIPEFGYLCNNGKPALPYNTITLAIPPGAVVQSVEVRGVRRELADTYKIEPALTLPISSRSEELRSGTSSLLREYKENKKAAYSSDALYPDVMGEFAGEGGFRRYNLVDVAIYPVAYRALSGKLYYASSMEITVRYRMDLEKGREALRLAGDNLMDEMAREVIYNWEQTKEWYAEKGSLNSTYDYVIITTSSLSSACNKIADWRGGLGHKVKIVTKEWITGAYPGEDPQQQIRNFLRDKYPVGSWGIKYVLIVGDYNAIPMRYCCTASNNPNNFGIGQIPTDLYYAELTNPDNVSWNKDSDQYWGEAVGYSGYGSGDDSPDYHADVHLGRIPWSNVTKISDISNKIISFERDTSLAYKKKALLAGGILFYANQNGNGNPKTDGATIMENTLDENCIERAYATTLYEKQGRAPSTYTSTDSITRSNIIKYWDGIGLFGEFNHGYDQYFCRTVWEWDDGDGVPEDHEISAPLCLTSTGVSLLDNNRPANCFLMSCLNGKPETSNNLGASLLYKGGISVICATRSAITGGEYLMYYYFRQLLRDTTSSHSIVGNAFDEARVLYAGGLNWSKWVNLYDFTLYGDPALYHFGHKENPCKDATLWVHNKGGEPGQLDVSNITYSQSWIIEVTPPSFMVSHGDSEGVKVTINPAGQPAGLYYDTLNISSNDPDKPTYKEPVILRVIGPGIEERESSEFRVQGSEFKVYPNPFTAGVRVQWSGVSEKQKISLRIYDLAGRLVKTLTPNPLSLTTAVEWDGRDKKGKPVRSGIYFAKVEISGYEATKKLILIR